MARTLLSVKRRQPSARWDPGADGGNTQGPTRDMAVESRPNAEEHDVRMGHPYFPWTDARLSIASVIHLARS